MRRARGEFAEMPGLQLTLHQAARLWGVDPETSARMSHGSHAAGLRRCRSTPGAARIARRGRKDPPYAG